MRYNLILPKEANKELSTTSYADMILEIRIYIIHAKPANTHIDFFALIILNLKLQF